MRGRLSGFVVEGGSDSFVHVGGETAGSLFAVPLMGEYMRIMGLDYGSKTVGVAVCDPLGITAQAVETIVRKDENKLRQTCRRLEALIQEYEITSIVLGYPKNMDDSVGERGRKTEEFKQMLERRTGLPVVLWDERLTTVEADEILRESGVAAKDRKKFIDKVAAGIILQSYLDALESER